MLRRAGRKRFWARHRRRTAGPFFFFPFSCERAPGRRKTKGNSILFCRQCYVACGFEISGWLRLARFHPNLHQTDDARDQAQQTRAGSRPVRSARRPRRRHREGGRAERERQVGRGALSSGLAGGRRDGRANGRCWAERLGERRGRGPRALRCCCDTEAACKAPSLAFPAPNPRQGAETGRNDVSCETTAG